MAVMLIARFEPGGLLEVARRLAQRIGPAAAPASAPEIGDRAA